MPAWMVFKRASSRLKPVPLLEMLTPCGTGFSLESVR
ncbi:hypothetical protein FX982_00445 [Pseudomonas graminis]|uniref:Uncharacterized protein n=1 Tax=Pseudomonas graminis TaxID=158627 RepID=A0A6M8MCG8_9PSED|nr:hypothetical protein FX982_00445 [Pseudomonas graminis]